MKKVSRISMTVMLLCAMIMSMFVNTDAQAASSDFLIEGNVLVKYNGSESSVTIPKNVKHIGELAFSNNKSIKSVTIPEGVKSIGNSAFQFCENLEKITIPKSVTTLSSGSFHSTKWFEEKKKESSLVIINDILIYGREAEGKVTVPKTVKAIADGTFSNNSKMTSITIPKSVKSIRDYAFYSCSGLKSITIPNSVKSLGRRAFNGCNNLEKITIPKSVKSIGGEVFSGTKWLVEQRKKNSLVVVNNILIDGRTATGAVSVPKGVTQIAQYAFLDGEKITSVTIPNGVKSIGDRAFYACFKLKKITIPKSVTYIGSYAFDWTDWLAAQRKKDPIVIVNDILIDGRTAKGEVVIPKNVTAISENAFNNSAITSVTIPSNVKSIGERAFYGCDLLTDVIISQSIKTVNNVFGNLIYYPDESNYPRSFINNTSESSDSSVIKINANGDLSLLKKGKATITTSEIVVNRVYDEEAGGFATVEVMGEKKINFTVN